MAVCCSRVIASPDQFERKSHGRAKSAVNSVATGRAARLNAGYSGLQRDELCSIANEKWLSPISVWDWAILVEKKRLSSQQGTRSQLL
jgi:hypothetical protein